MAGARGFLDRLRQREGYGARTVQPRVEDVYESIQSHLRCLLNTRKGDSPAFPDYGLPALSDLSLEGGCEEVRRQIEQTIKQYENRLTSVRVRYVEPDPGENLKLRFQISGRPLAAKSHVFKFDTQVDTISNSSCAWKVTD